MKKILVIEDNLELRENISEILELAGYNVNEAENGKVGVEKAKSWGPDLIICDIMMPVLDGYGVLHLLTRDPQTASTPFIFLTAKTERQSQRKGMAMGADDYLTKPFEDTELLEAIDGRLKRMSVLQSNGDGDSLGGFIGSGEEALQQLHEHHRTRSYGKKDILYHKEDDSHFLYYLKTGRVKRVRGDSFGKELVTSVIEPGEFFGHLEILSESPHQDTAVAMEDSVVELIPADSLKSLISQDRDVAVHFLKWLSTRVSDNEERLLKLAYQPVRERTADVLIDLFDKAGAAAESPSIQVSRDDLAGMVGTATESLIRVLSSFRQEGIIESSGRTIRLLDRDKLRAQILG